VTIRNKIFIYNILIILFSILLMTILVNIITSKAILKNAKTKTQRELSLIVNNIDSIVHNVNNYIISFSIEKNLQDVLKDFPELPVNPAEIYNAQIKSLESYTYIRGLNEYIESYEIYNSSFEPFKVSGYIETSTHLGITEEEKQIINKTLYPQWMGPSKFRNKTTKLEEWVLVINKKVIDYNAGKHLGFVSFYLKEDKLKNVLSPLDNLSGDVHIINNKNIIVSSTERDNIGEKLHNVLTLNKNQLSSLYEKKSGTYKLRDIDIFISVQDYKKLGWKIIYAIPYNIISSEKNILLFTIILIGFSCVLVSFFVSFLVSNNISKPIFSLANVMTSIKNGDLNVRFPVKSTNEIGVLGMGFNSLMDKIDTLLKTVYSEQRQLRDYEFKLIQAQINPHFLYNSLGMIESLINIREYEEAVSHVHSLTNFYRLSLSTGADLITLEQEFQITESYLEIQKRRYIEYIDFSLHLEEKVKFVIIPKLTLQPIVENSIYHGLKESKNKGFIKVLGKCVNNELLLTVHDTGKGIDPEKISTLLQTGDNESFGLHSINKRIQLLFGENYGITIESELNSYTKVVIRIPIEMNRTM
jgi:two-component system sensor histidine kinase YesM